jgi:hypothetical protein
VPHSAGRKAATVDTERMCDNLAQKSKLKVNCFYPGFQYPIFFRVKLINQSMALVLLISSVK